MIWFPDGQQICFLSQDLNLYMKLNLYMLSWMVALLPTKHQAILCCTGATGYTSFKETVSSSVFPARTIHLVDIGDPALQTEGAQDDFTQSIQLCRVVSLTRISTEPDHGFVQGDGIPNGRSDLHLRVLSNSPFLPNGFLSENDDLVTVDLTGLRFLKEMPDLLCGCPKLRSISLEALRHVDPEEPADGGEGASRNMGWVCFLYGCRGLTSVDLTPLSHIRRVPEGFLTGCCGLREIDLTPLSQILAVGCDFLFGCHGLRAIDLSPVSHVTILEEGFLSQCASLVELDMRPLVNVKDLPRYFLVACRELTTLHLPPNLKMTYVACAFLEQCSKLLHLDLSPLRGVGGVGHSFLSECETLTHLDLRPLCEVTRLPRGFLKSMRLKEIDLSSWFLLEGLPAGFCDGLPGDCVVKLPSHLR